MELSCASRYMIAVPGAIMCDVFGKSRWRYASKHDCCCVLGAAAVCVDDLFDVDDDMSCLEDVLGTMA
jgi:hypothetical protein